MWTSKSKRRALEKKKMWRGTYWDILQEEVCFLKIRHIKKKLKKKSLNTAWWSTLHWLCQELIASGILTAFRWLYLNTHTSIHDPSQLKSNFKFVFPSDPPLCEATLFYCYFEERGHLLCRPIYHCVSFWLLWHFSFLLLERHYRTEMGHFQQWSPPLLASPGSKDVRIKGRKLMWSRFACITVKQITFIENVSEH